MIYFNKSNSLKVLSRSFITLNGQVKELALFASYSNEQLLTVGKTKAGSLYEFSSHKFTNCGQTGRLGPTLTMCRNAYGTSWSNDTSYFNMQSQGIQIWTVPVSGLYSITAWGAGRAESGIGIKGTFKLKKNDKLHILIGQLGGSRTACGSGGTFVALGDVITSTKPLIVAGGGGGYWETILAPRYQRATDSIEGNPGSHSNGGRNGQGAYKDSEQGGGGGGGGFYTNGHNGLSGQEPLVSVTGGFGFLQGGEGGNFVYDSTVQSDHVGGFGGGGAAGGGVNVSGGGGGYSGGGGGYQYPNNNNGDKYFGSGGAGSYNAGNDQTILGWRSGHGEVVISLV